MKRSFKMRKFQQRQGESDFEQLESSPAVMPKSKQKQFWNSDLVRMILGLPQFAMRRRNPFRLHLLDFHLQYES